MRIKKNIFIFIAILLFCSINKRLSSEIKNSYTILSKTQTNETNGNFEAIGNVKIKGEDNFSASSDKLIYEKNFSKLKLIGNVEIENYKIDNLIIENILSDELILFIDNGRLIINSKEGKRVKTRIKL
tara:strand:+ start:339 stop:722 length:384 start_codon:yes stop_codon:yes gene_type:complete